MEEPNHSATVNKANEVARQLQSLILENVNANNKLDELVKIKKEQAEHEKELQTVMESLHLEIVKLSGSVNKSNKIGMKISLVVAALATGSFATNLVSIGPRGQQWIDVALAWFGVAV